MRPGGLKIAGTRYAYIYKKDSLTCVLNMNGVEVEGHFEHWDEPLSCATGVNWNYRDSTGFLRVKYDKSLTTFVVTTREGERITYIDGKVADNSLLKLYPTMVEAGMSTVDTTSYTLTKRKKKRREDGSTYLSWEMTSNFYFGGNKGPDYRTITGVRYDEDNESYTYIGSATSEGEKQYDLVDVQDGVILFTHFGKRPNLLKSEFGDRYCKLEGKKESGYWVNGHIYTGEGKPLDILFSAKGEFRFISKQDIDTYYWITKKGTSERIRFIDAHYDYMDHLNNRIVEVRNDSIYCYEENHLVYVGEFSFGSPVTYAYFERSSDEETIMIKIHIWRGQSYFSINNRWFLTSSPPPEGYVIHHSTRRLAKFLGFSESGNKYAYQEYEYDKDAVWLNIYINDSLLGKFPNGTDFQWGIEDRYRLAYSGVQDIFLEDTTHQYMIDNHNRFIKKYYPLGAPSYLRQLFPSNDNYRVDKLDNGVWYLDSCNIVKIAGHEFKTWANTINFGLLENDSIYYLRKADQRCFVYINFKMVYSSPRIDGVTAVGNSLKFYSYEGDKVYWVSCTAKSNPENDEEK